MDKESWLQHSKEERVAYLSDVLEKLIEVTKLQKECRRKHFKEPSYLDKRLLEKKVFSIIEWEKEEHE